MFRQLGKYKINLEEIMNCKKAKKISLVSILDKIGAEKKKITEREVWYLSPFSNEKTASFKIDTNKNVWFDFGSGKGGNVLDFIMLNYKCDLKGALAILDKDCLSFSFHQQSILKIASERKKNYEVRFVKPISNYNLIDYVKSRFLNIQMVKKFCIEVHYEINGKSFYGIGFKNNLEGYEIRNKYFKGCLGKKAITTINRQSDIVSLFESWSDFLSYLTLKNKIPDEDFLILNSANQILNTNEELKKYSKIKIFFDNDNSGNKAADFLKNNLKTELLDCRKHFFNYNDLNDYLISIKQNDVLKFSSRKK
jgi:5S rRNA maturation endonuclease (ribonuclease M5)